MAGAFDRAGVDTIQFVRSNSGNRCLSTISLSGSLPSRHGVPRELLSDRGAAFLSSLMKEVCQIMGLRKVNTTAYNPHGDGLVERINRTFRDMSAKTIDKSKKDWDVCLLYVLFAYRTSMQEYHSGGVSLPSTLWSRPVPTNRGCSHHPTAV